MALWNIDLLVIIFIDNMQLRFALCLRFELLNSAVMCTEDIFQWTHTVTCKNLFVTNLLSVSNTALLRSFSKIYPSTRADNQSLLQTSARAYLCFFNTDRTRLWFIQYLCQSGTFKVILSFINLNVSARLCTTSQSVTQDPDCTKHSCEYKTGYFNRVRRLCITQLPDNTCWIIQIVQQDTGKIRSLFCAKLDPLIILCLLKAVCMKIYKDRK